MSRHNIGRAVLQPISPIDGIIRLQQNGIEAIVELFDGFGLSNHRSRTRARRSREEAT
jgi:hypothetical protein